MMRFDYYSARVEVPPPVLISELQKLGHEILPCDGLARSYHYDQGFQIKHSQNGVVATVLAGGNGDYPFALASGDATDAFVDVLRTRWPDQHLPTRLDPCQDFNDSTAFPRLRRTCRDIAQEHGLAFPAISDELNPKAGRTQYMGSPKSDHRARLYEKGFQLASKHGIQSPGGSSDDLFILNPGTGEMVRAADWVRLEGQIRPQGEEARRLAAHASPEETMGFTAWTRELAFRALSIDLKRIYMRIRKQSSDEQALFWMVRQYLHILERNQASPGDWKSVGDLLGDIAKQIKEGMK